MAKEHDVVNHPSHYESSCSLECIDVMEAMFSANGVIYFCLCNTFKYLWRYKNKNGDEDIEKAEWYLDKAGELMDEDESLARKFNEMYENLSNLFEKVRRFENEIS